MMHTYEGAIEKQGGGWVVTFPAFPGCLGDGETVQDACESAAISLQLVIADYVDKGTALPGQSISEPPRAVFVVEVSDSFIAETKCMMLKQAAEELCVSQGRITQLLTSGQLEAYEAGGRRLVTIASVNGRKANLPAPHRPKKQHEESRCHAQVPSVLEQWHSD